MRSDLRKSLDDVDASGREPARTYVQLLGIFGRVLDVAESEGRELTVWEKASLNKAVTWLMHGKLRAAHGALDLALAKPEEIASDAVRDDEIPHLSELAIADFRRALKYLGALEPWM
jgi:hypothetical protein